MHRDFSLFSDRELLIETDRLATVERRATADLLAILAELDSRKLYLSEGCSSLFTYCTQVLHLSEPAAYSRITAARAARKFPVILEMLGDGALTLTTITLIAAHLDEDNHAALLESVRGKSKREVERIVAGLDPKPDVPALVRRVSVSKIIEASVPLASQVSEQSNQADRREQRETGTFPVTRPVIAPLGPTRYLIKITVSHETHDKLERARDLMRHVIPTGDPAAVIDRALTVLLTQLEKTRDAQPVRKIAARPSASRRQIPAAVKRAVWTRDQGRCAFQGTNGRCSETAFLEFHHLQFVADGGPATVENLELRCRPHNAHENHIRAVAMDSAFDFEVASSS